MENHFQKGPLLAQGREAEIFTCGEEKVIKLFREGFQNHAEHEMRIANSAYAGGVRTPRPYEIVEIDGREGIIYERVNGPSMLSAFVNQPWRIGRLSRHFAELHASLHRISMNNLNEARPSLEQSILHAPHLPDVLRREALSVLQRLPDGDNLCHGDFHPDNIMITPTGLVVIDWPNARRGCPLADVARSTIMMQIGILPPGMPIWQRVGVESGRRWFFSEYIRTYSRITDLDHIQLLAWEIPVAAARLAEHIAGEEDALIALIRKNLGKI
jgi:tRNA A-37 threonylcarbamoyl transferase component Bud32